MQKPEFAEAPRKARREAFSQAIARLQYGSEAVNTLLRVIADCGVPHAARVRAAVRALVLGANKTAELRIIESQVRDVEPGQAAHLDTCNCMVHGQVRR